MKYCATCGAKLEDTARFCSACGAAVEIRKSITCGHCGQEVEEGQLFCPLCGYRLGLKGRPQLKTESDPGQEPNPGPEAAPEPAPKTEPKEKFVKPADQDIGPKPKQFNKTGQKQTKRKMMILAAFLAGSQIIMLPGIFQRLRDKVVWYGIDNMLYRFYGYLQRKTWQNSYSLYHFICLALGLLGIWFYMNIRRTQDQYRADRYRRLALYCLIPGIGLPVVMFLIGCLA